jgi:hypothetical protein
MTDLHFSQGADQVTGFGLQEHYIDGAFRASAAAETFESLNPATNEVLAVAAAGEAADVDLAVGAARRAFEGDGAGGWVAADRGGDPSARGGVHCARGG